LFAYEHIDNPPAAENGLHYYPSRPMVVHVADPRGPCAEWMRLERCQRGVSIFRWHDADYLAFVRKVKWIKTQYLAEAFDLGSDRRPVFKDLDAYLRRFGDFVQDSRQSSAGGIPQKSGAGNR
jgi:hypothetical protein